MAMRTAIKKMVKKNVLLSRNMIREDYCVFYCGKDSEKMKNNVYLS